jgi:DNA-binding XRE family transcriptional regulator
MSAGKTEGAKKPRGTHRRVLIKRSAEGQKKLGLRISELRRTKGWPQEELAHNCGINRTYMGEIERGLHDVQMITLLKIAKGLGMTVGALVKGIT